MALARNPLLRLPPARFSKRTSNHCLACDQAGACRDWVLTMADDAGVNAKWLAWEVLAGQIDHDWGVSGVAEAYVERPQRN